MSMQCAAAMKNNVNSMLEIITKEPQIILFCNVLMQIYNVTIFEMLYIQPTTVYQKAYYQAKNSAENGKRNY